jgi:peptide deformylase
MKEIENIITLGSEYESVILSRADEVDVRKEGNAVRQTVLTLKKKIREHNLTSLSAPAVGINKRIFVINFNGDLRSFVNPIATKYEGIELSREVCSSLPGKTYIRPRNSSVTVTYQTPLGKIESKKFIGKAATVVQHEIDHLEGLLLSDIALEIDEAFDSAPEEERLAVINAYLDSLDMQQKELEAEIESDPELKQVNDAIDFMQSVAKGETTVVSENLELINNSDKEGNDEAPSEEQC